MFVNKIYSLLLLLLVLNCSTNVATGGTETGNPATISGTVFDENGNIAVGVEVTLLPVNYNPVVDPPVADSFMQIADSLGRYSFDNIGHDTFNIEFVDDEAEIKALRICVTAQEPVLDDYVDTLRPVGVVKVILPGSDESKGYIYIKGTSFYQFVTGNVNFLDNVPAGTIPEIIHFSSNVDSVVLIDSMTVELNDTAVQAQALYITSGKYDSLGIITRIVTAKLREFGISVKIIEAINLKESDTAGVSAVIISPIVESKVNIIHAMKELQLPLVNMEYLLLAGLGMTDTVKGIDYGGLFSQKQQLIDVVNSTHLIAGGLSGTIKMFSDSGYMEWGKPSSNASTIATVFAHPDKAIIFAYEKESDMVGIKAPARRAGFLLNGTEIVNVTDELWYMYRKNMIKWLFE